MRAHHGISRRHVLSMAVAVGGLAISGGVSGVLAQAFKRTPLQTRGRFIRCSNLWIRTLT